MDASRFDAISKLFASRRLSRREAMVKGGTALAATGLAAAGLSRAAAQDATPEVASPPPMDNPPAQLFVQSFQTGSIAPATGEFGTHTVTLGQGLGQTIVFTDRPSRDVFTAPTPAFLDGFGFDADNPPNAAMLMETADGATDIAVVELFNPTYDEATHTATYDIAALANWENELELGFHEAPTDLSNLSDSFGATHLFIDDCYWADVACLKGGQFAGQGDIEGTFRNVYKKFWWSVFTCVPETPNAETIDDVQTYWVGQCNATFAACEGQCNQILY